MNDPIYKMWKVYDGSGEWLADVEGVNEIDALVFAIRILKASGDPRRPENAKLDPTGGFRVA